MQYLKNEVGSIHQTDGNAFFYYDFIAIIQQHYILYTSKKKLIAQTGLPSHNIYHLKILENITVFVWNLK